MNETYIIKINGNGTKEAIIRDLNKLIESLEAEKSVAVLDGAEWEGATLMTEIQYAGNK
jgi:hypothetical protein